MAPPSDTDPSCYYPHLLALTHCEPRLPAADGKSLPTAQCHSCPGPPHLWHLWLSSCGLGWLPSPDHAYSLTELPQGLLSPRTPGLCHVGCAVRWAHTNPPVSRFLLPDRRSSQTHRHSDWYGVSPVGGRDPICPDSSWPASSGLACWLSMPGS